MSGRRHYLRETIPPGPKAEDVAGPHECNEKCRAHKCKPLTAFTIRKVHWCLSGALKDAMRWKWITVDPLEQAEPPKAPTPDPKPPTPGEAGAIVNRAFKELSWGVLVWLAMTTGARRGELCALRWDLLDLDNASLWIRTAIAQDGSKTWEKDTKTHQQRRIALDAETVALLRAYRQHCETQAALADTAIAPDGRVFSPSADHTRWLKPSTVSQRYRRMCAKLGWDMHLSIMVRESGRSRTNEPGHRNYSHPHGLVREWMRRRREKRRKATACRSILRVIGLTVPAVVAGFVRVATWLGDALQPQDELADLG